jgi:hypothetical protein
MMKMLTTPPRYPIDITPLIRAALCGGPLATALGRGGLLPSRPGSAKYDDRLLGGLETRFSLDED